LYQTGASRGSIFKVRSKLAAELAELSANSASKTLVSQRFGCKYGNRRICRQEPIATHVINQIAEYPSKTSFSASLGERSYS
jgi:hypothetical protein